jgi:DNA polymerase-1
VDPSTTPANAPPPAQVYLLDSHGLVFQMFHGIPQMNAPDGRPTNAVFGVTRSLLDLYERGAEYLLAVFDCKEPTFREKLFADYKAHRPPPPDDLLIQEPMIHAILDAMRVPILKQPGYEADDVIATVATAGAAKGLTVAMCTSDKDCRQLLQPNVRIQNLRKGAVLDEAGLMADWGVKPEQVVDFQTLVGDSVDNVPGVPGCGAKTAAKWLQQFGTLENILKNTDYIGGPKLREALKKAHADGSLAVSRKLVELDKNVPMAIDWEGWKRRGFDLPRLLDLFQEFGFRSFANRARTIMGEKGPVAAPKAVGLPSPGSFDLIGAIDGTVGQPSPGFQEPPPPPVEWKGDYKLVDTPEAFAAFLEQLRKQSRFCFDLETTSLEPMRADIVGYAFSWKAEEAFYLPVRGPGGSTLLPPESTLAALKPILEDPKVAKVNQNIKYDLLVLRASGVELKGIAGDSMVAHYLLHAGERTHDLDGLTKHYFGHGKIATKELLGSGKKQITMDQVPTDKVGAYAGEDADAAWRLTGLLEPQLETINARKLYDEIEIPLIDVLAELEFNGVLLDLPFLKTVGDEMAVQLAGLEKKAHEQAGREFNVASPKQLREILFDEMKLPIQKRTGTTGEASTDQESLEALAAMGHALPQTLIEHRGIAKLKGTYVDALPALVNPRTGRVHTSFNQTVAATGRLSSSDPNLQNIPMRTEQGKQIRKAFVPPPGWRILSADYSQIELRLLAHFCGDEDLKRAFAEEQDIHMIVAARVFNTTADKVTSDQRRMAKTVNFGILYGMSATGLAVRLGITRQDAAKFIDDYFARYPTVLAYQDGVIAQARRDGYVATILGRRRFFNQAALRPNSSYRQRNQAEREAINMEIQGSAADLMKKAMLNVGAAMRKAKLEARLLLSVHDELVFETPPGEVVRLAKLVREEMGNAMALGVPLRVDVSAGPNWLDGEDVG